MRIREFPAIIVLVCSILYLALRLPAIRGADNLILMGQQVGLLGIMACGQTLVVLTGGIDLSVGAAAAAAACVAGIAMHRHIPVPTATLLGLSAGAFCGFVNGALITWRRLPPILVTLSTLLLIRAAMNIMTGAIPYNNLPTGFKNLGAGNVPLIIFSVTAVLASWVLVRARLGRRLIATGGNAEAARLSGIPTGAILRRAYLFCGLLAGISGMLTAAASNAAQWNLADGYELDAIAMVVIGGVKLTGGEGSIAGTALGAGIVVLWRNALFLMGMPPEQYGLVTGAIILVAAFSEQLRNGGGLSRLLARGGA